MVPSRPLLSVVLPVYGVAGYLRECLDSMVSQSFTDIEIIAVDDCSPDNSGAILDEYAKRDPRVRVVHLTANVGLGQARNIGMAEATGTYLWFVDSDDRVTEGSFKAIAAKLHRTEPDVLLIDHAKVWVSGWSKRSPMSTRLPENGVPETFAAVDEPRVLRPLHTAWSRLIRREFLIGLGLVFQPSVWYEDVSFTYPVTAAAERVAVLHRVCYHYRQRRQGSITGSRGDDRHFEMFDQYAVVFETLDRWGITDPALRIEMFNRMQWHTRWVYAETKRVPRRRRREFFARMSADYRRFRPDGHVIAGGGEGLKQRLIQRDAWPLFSAFRVARAAVRGGRSTLKNAYRSGRRVARRATHLGRRALMELYYRIQLTLPLDRELAVYAAYWYRGVRCSPAAIYYKARELAPDVRGVWIVKSGRTADVPAGVDHVVEGSMRYYRVLARATYLVNNVNFPDGYRKRSGSVFVQTHHGTPLKVMGMDHYRYPIGAQGTDLAALLRRCDNWDISISTSPFNTEIWQRSYPSPHRTLEVGYPRNDRLAVATREDVAAARESLGLRDGETAVLFAPTHREYQSGYQPSLDIEELADALGPDIRVLARPHYYYDSAATSGRPSRHPRILDVSAHPDVELLYLAADVLITDYSSMMFDYAYLDRPILIFAPDWDTYCRTRGVTFDLMAEPPGTVATTFRDVVTAFTDGELFGVAATKARSDFRDRFCPHTDGRSSERVVRDVFLGETM